ncbi:hypothetical protein F6R98_03105 [Candidatus Methylospira mobilis]|uniref:Uncharacterized protein n=1 Tax=Candidatus Methylospira mobilis TaxID=1808979 RepID=A0A5Q0BHQ2_9GAMM|nr:hypothetical protein [Candidatus Methylospira mobilis]QFY41741.1 hypothetical protein F6R98_03105 [Candidatus Methylospira mobilis]
MKTRLKNGSTRAATLRIHAVAPHDYWILIQSLSDIARLLRHITQLAQERRQDNSHPGLSFDRAWLSGCKGMGEPFSNRLKTSTAMAALVLLVDGVYFAWLCASEGSVKIFRAFRPDAPCRRMNAASADSDGMTMFSFVTEHNSLI